MKEFPLPIGAVLLKRPVRKTLGNYVEMSYDARIVIEGIRWYRVKDGMGTRGDREDWVADLPEYGLSVHDYYWNHSIDFGKKYGDTFEEAIIGVVKESHKNIQSSIEQKEIELSRLKETSKRIADYVSKFQKEKKNEAVN